MKINDFNIFHTDHELPFVSIIIPVYKDWEKLKKCLTALKGQNYPEKNLEIIVVDNEALSEPPTWIEEYNNVQVLRETKPGSYAARNTGIKKARGNIVGFTDADCVPNPEWVSKAVEVLQENKLVSRLAGAIRLTFQDQKPKNMIELFEKVFAFNQIQMVEEFGSAITANAYSYKDIFFDVGLFNEDLMSGGDKEWGIRAYNAGYKIIFAPEVIVNHPARSTWKSIIEKTRRTIGGKVTLDSMVKSSLNTRKHFSGLYQTIQTDELENILQRMKVLFVLYTLKGIKIFERAKIKLGAKSQR